MVAHTTNADGTAMVQFDYLGDVGKEFAKVFIANVNAVIYLDMEDNVYVELLYREQMTRLSFELIHIWRNPRWPREKIRSMWKGPQQIPLIRRELPPVVCPQKAPGTAVGGDLR